VPADIVTRVESLRDAKASLRTLVGVENVSTNKGRRTYKQRSQQTGFTKVGESGKIPKMASPQFSIVEYIISKFAGWLPVTNELMDDSDANITQSITEWIADEARVTDNKNILAIIKAKAAVAFTGLDDIKKALIVTLGSAFLPTSKIITNDDGLFWLSALKDKNGRDLLTPIPTQPAMMQLSVGARVVPVEVLPNDDFPSTGAKIPFVLGDLNEGIRLFDRKMLTVTSSDVAVAGTFNAFEQDMTLTRAIIREDVKLRDGAAFIYGEVDTAVPPKV
ncbi:MAG: phage major capsid protein, partial [Oscillospiraceae bacterium]